MIPLETEIQKRRTFGIISHPDAGKTTLTEKLLLFGGAIQVAGAIKAKKASRHATSDFMEIEKQRGISVATSVMGFNYKGKRINLLDTPGHADFCEDTYRTLTAVDSAIMVIDSTKGVETQTYKLLEVCRMRETPIITFINKLDREGIEAVDLLDNVEAKLSITVCPMSWPIGMGKRFKGVYSFYDQTIILFKAHGKQEDGDSIKISNINDPLLDETIGEDFAQTLREELELIQGVYPKFKLEDYLSGKITPIFFGSALNNFGVRELLDAFIEMAPAPHSHLSDQGIVPATNAKFSGFIFKIHANIDPKHRDRIAFLRICSGRFERNKKYHHVRSNKTFRTSNPTAFMAQAQEVVEEAYPGDIIGVHDTGTLKIGDTLTEGGLFNYKGIPSFSPEIFRIVKNEDPLKTKQLLKGIDQLCEEGVAQVFTHVDGQRLIGTVGVLQFDVIQYRLDHEYGAKCRFEPLNFIKACWIEAESDIILKEFINKRRRHIATDKDGAYVYLSETQWSLDREIKEQTDIQFFFHSDKDINDTH